MIYIYGLEDPRNGRIKYIGETGHLKSRYYAHTSNRKNKKTWAWVCELKREGLRPKMRVLDVVYDKKKAAQVESDHIGLFKFAAQVGGWELLNSEPVPPITNDVSLHTLHCNSCKTVATMTGIFEIREMAERRGGKYFCLNCGGSNLEYSVNRLSWDEYWRIENDEKD